MTARLLTAAQVADLLGLTPGAVYQLSYLGKLPGKVKIGARVRFQADAIEEVIAHGLPPTAAHAARSRHSR